MIIFIIDNDNHYQRIAFFFSRRNSLFSLDVSTASEAKKGIDDMNAMGIKGKIAFITGAAQGIGEAVARKLADQGAHIAAVDYNPEKLERL